MHDLVRRIKMLEFALKQERWVHENRRRGGGGGGGGVYVDLFRLLMGTIMVNLYSRLYNLCVCMCVCVCMYVVQLSFVSW